MGNVPESRIRCVNDGAVRQSGRFVVYWMTAFRRLTWNFGLDRAIEHCTALGKPLVILEALRCDYPWASGRIHRFVMDGMLEHQAALMDAPVHYHPYVEPKKGAGRGLLEALGAEACLVVTDDFPAFFHPHMLQAAGDRLDVRLEAIDANGLVPLALPEKVFSTAYAFRRWLQKYLPELLRERPRARGLAGLDLPRPVAPGGDFLERWPATPREDLEGDSLLQRLPIDHAVRPVGEAPGGARAGTKALRRFIKERLSRYAAERNTPEQAVTSELSPFLHFGHVSPHQVFTEIVRQQGWTIDKLSTRSDGRRAGWWGMDENAEAFLDQFVTWRELGFNASRWLDDHDRFESLPFWARSTLQAHEGDERPYLYDRDQFEEAATHDPLWNAAQRQLINEGRIHNYLRMLWGKKILHWSASPRDALDIMVHLNNKYALDGRDPNSYSGIFWVLGRYDRPWGPERKVFGKIRYMSSKNTARKVRVKGYIARNPAPAATHPRAS